MTSTDNPVVAVLPTVGWYAIFREGPDGQLYAVPVEHATVHEDGQRALWEAQLNGSVRELAPMSVVRAGAAVTSVQWGPDEWATVLEESTASWRPV